MNIVIVGCGSGIGKYLVEHLIREHEVLSVSRNLSGVSTLLPFRASVTDPASLVYCASHLKNNLGWDYIDAIIYCAGIQGIIGKTMNMLPEEWMHVMNTNLNGFFNTFWAFKDLLGKSETPRVMAIAGGGATKARENFSAYAASKTALVRLVETLALENPTWRINTISPGAIKTRMIEEIQYAGPHIAGQKEYDDAQKAQAEATEALELVKFLLTPDSDHITGRLIAAKWDDWRNPKCYAGDTGTLRRIEPAK